MITFLLLPCEAGEVARRVGGVTEEACLARPSVIIEAHAPSTKLRVVPLARCAGEEKLIIVKPLRGFADLFETYKFGRQLCFASLASR